MRDISMKLEMTLFAAIFICLMILLFRIVIPNMSVKAIPIGWMTMFGATIIFAYSTFFELKDIKSIDCFSTEAVFFPDYSRKAFKMAPPSLKQHTDIVELFHKGEIIEKDIPEGKYRDDVAYAFVLGKEHLQLCLTCFLSCYRDWQRLYVKSTGQDLIVYPDGELPGSIKIFEGDCLVNSEYELFNISPSVKNYNRIFGKSIYPKGTRFYKKDDFLYVRNKIFTYKIKVIHGGRAGGWFYDRNEPVPEQRTSIPYIVQQEFIIHKRFAGHHSVPLYERFRNVLMEEVHQAFVVEKR